jgi:hypothetical protein
MIRGCIGQSAAAAASLFLLLGIAKTPSRAEDAKDGKPNPSSVEDRIQGNWLGEWTLAAGGGGKQTAQIVALGKGQYQAAFTAYDGSDGQSETFRFQISGSLIDKKGVFSTQIDLGEKLGVFDWSADVENDSLLGKFSNKKNYTGLLKLKRVEIKPEGLGAKPLPGAVVLFDGTNLDQWRQPDGAPAWEVRDGAIRCVPREAADGKIGRHLATKEPIGSAQIHLEFRTPYLPEAREQERGNSGVFLQGRYEIQIVDSFGQPRKRNNFGDLSDDDSAGAIYKHSAPTENKTLPPGEWQTFDITFLPAKAGADGTAEQPAQITVVHNGTTIHDGAKIRKSTSGAPLKDLATPGGLVLEDGGQGVEFRNVWMVPLNAK